MAGFVASAEFTSAGRTFRGYLQSESCVGFRSWTDKLADAKRFDTRALARRAAAGMKGVRVSLTAATEAES